MIRAYPYSLLMNVFVVTSKVLNLPYGTERHRDHCADAHGLQDELRTNDAAGATGIRELSSRPRGCDREAPRVQFMRS